MALEHFRKADALNPENYDLQNRLGKIPARENLERMERLLASSQR